MRKLILFATAITASAVFAGDVFAKTRPLHGRYTANQVLSACNKGGGSYSENSHGYGCDKANCDGKGGTCSVQCKDGKCTGTTPARVAGSLGIMNVLGNGTAVQIGGTPKGVPGSILDSSSGFAAQNPSAAGSPMTPAAPPKPPVPQIR